VSALKDINPWDPVVELLRDKHNLLIGEPTAEKVQFELGNSDPERPATVTVKGRSLVTGLPAAVEVSSNEVQAVDNTEASLRYIRWEDEGSGQSIGNLLYVIAANEVNWLYAGVVQEAPPNEIEALFERDEEKIYSRIYDETLAQHWTRMDAVREELVRVYRKMTLEEFQQLRQGPETSCTAEWVLHELCQFEAEQRSEIRRLLAAARSALDPATNA
jgi:hypothetical protein